MPRYIYKCEECEVVFEISHGFRQDPTPCPECNKTEFLKKQLTTPISLVKKNFQTSKKSIGSVVNETIEETKEDIKKEKEAMKKRIKK
jgi:putative FmdB family regulatory protein|tara:strand:+ start:906 stop:1169 length:264 start_codon:yes stop_codon:yes gene_type:complete